jgi:hypothetical protein
VLMLSSNERQERYEQRLERKRSIKCSPKRADWPAS